MGDLRDAFKKAGLINEQDERRFQHEERVRKKGLGKEGRAAERAQQRARHGERRAEEKERVQGAQAKHDAKVQGAADRKVLLREARDQALKQGVQGTRRLHYRDPEGWLPQIAVSDEVQRKLEQGELGIVADPDAPTRILFVPRGVVKKLAVAAPETVLLWSGG